MPELPEVETVRATLAGVLPGRTVVDVVTDGSARFAPADAARGATVTSVRRAGKYLLIGLCHADGDAGADRAAAVGSGAPAVDPSRADRVVDLPGTNDPEDGEDAELVVHLGMSGQLLLVDPAVPSPRFRFRATLVASGEEPVVLELRDVRGFGRAAVVAPGDHRDLGVLGRLGLEPDDAGLADWLATRLAGRTVAIKAVLLDQAVIAGVGNIYADEALHRAGIHPESRAGDLRPEAVAALSASVRDVIADGVAHGGTTLRDYRRADGTDGGHQHHLAVFGRDGEPCPRCGATIVKIRVAGRGTHLCPDCQPRARRRPRRAGRSAVRSTAARQAGVRTVR